MYALASRRHPLPRPSLLRSHFELVRFFRQEVPAGPGMKLLEVGCGDSVWLPYFNREFGFEVFGVDYSEVGCHLARRNLDACGAHGTIECVDMFDLHKEWSGQFHFVISFGVVEHFDNPREVIGLLSGLLRPSGLLFTYVPNLDSFAGLMVKAVDRSFFDTHRKIDLDTLEGYHFGSGMAIVRSTYLQWLDFTMLGFTNLPPKLRSLLMRGIKVTDLIPLYAERLFGLNPRSRSLSSFMAVLARKEYAAGPS